MHHLHVLLKWFAHIFCNKQVIQILDKQRCTCILKTTDLFRPSLWLVLVAFISRVKFSKIGFPALNFVWGIKFTYKNNFCQSLLLKAIEIRLFYLKLNSRKRGNLSNYSEIAHFQHSCQGIDAKLVFDKQFKNLGILKAGCPGELKKTCSNHAVLVEEPQWVGEKYKVFFEVVEKAF